MANLQRAAALPWRDGGRCAVQEASQPWPVLVERCFQALDHERIRFNDPTGRCGVASAGAAALGVGLCILVAPEVIVGAVIITGGVVAAVAIKAALEEYKRPEAQTKRVSEEPQPEPESKPQPSGQDVFPPVPPESLEQERRPECRPRRVKHLGGNELHNRCADRTPGNDFSGWDALVNGKNFDGLQLRARTLWEVKTHAIDTYSPFVQRTELDKQVKEGQRERRLAAACGYDFVIGVRTEVHRQLLRAAAPDLTVVLMTWC